MDLGKLTLLILTIGGAWFLFEAPHASDAEGKIIGACLGASGIILAAPFWVYCRARVPLWIALTAAVGAVVTSLFAVVSAYHSAGDNRIRVWHVAGLLCMLVPGAGLLLLSFIDRVRATKGPSR